MITDILLSHSKQLCHSLLRQPKCIGVEYDLHLHFSSSSFIHKDSRFHAFCCHVRSHCRTEILSCNFHHLLFFVSIHCYSHASGTRKAYARDLSHSTASKFNHLCNLYKVLTEMITLLRSQSLSLSNDTFEVPVLAIAHHSRQFA